MARIDVEEQIRAAMARGEFDNLAGAGRPQNHDPYFSLPEDVRMGYTVLRNSGYVPREVELLREIGALREELKRTQNPGRRLQIQRAINEKQLSFDVMLEHQERHRRTMRKAGD